jgi:predicted ABC-class ATPase
MLPKYVAGALLYGAIDAAALLSHIESVEDGAYLRAQLHSLGLVSFVADGSILPRVSGASDTPMLK